MKENAGRSLFEAVKRYEKQEEERGARFFKEKDSERILKQGVKQTSSLFLFVH